MQRKVGRQKAECSQELGREAEVRQRNIRSYMNAKSVNNCWSAKIKTDTLMIEFEKHGIFLL